MAFFLQGVINWKKRIHRSIRYEFDIDNVNLKLTRTQKNKSYTPIIAKKIKEQLLLPGNEDLYDYIQWIYLSLMRPKEIRFLKVADINLNTRKIRIIGKTGDRLIPISDQLLQLINKRNLMIGDPNAFVFGVAGRVSLKRISIQYFLDKYDIIKKKLKLGTEYKIYSWKATGVQDMLVAGFKDAEIMVLTGHKSEKSFNAYKQDLVIDNSHVMKGRTIDF